MTITVEPKNALAISDNPTDTAAGKITPTRWNAGHAIKQATARLLGRTTAGDGDTEEISVGAGLSFSALQLLLDIATAANIRARTANKALTADNIASAKAAVALAYASTRSLVWTDGFFRTCTLTGNMTISNPTNIEVGDTIVLRLVGDSATERSISWGTYYGGSLPEETVTSSRKLLISLFAASSTEIDVSYVVRE